MKAKFGPAGNSISFGKRKKEELKDYLNEFNLDAYEYQCGHGVRIKSDFASSFRDLMSSFTLSLHTPYYISLSSVDEQKRDNSIDYILQSAIAAKSIGAKRIIVHSGSCSKISRKDALSLSKDTLKRALLKLKDENLDDITICPETMGKINQLGTLDEVLELCSIDDSFIPCIDFGHLNARSFGGIKTIKDYESILNSIENKLGYDRLKIFHSHFSKIEYSKIGGEVRHLTFEDNIYGPSFEPLAELVYKKNLCPTFICESSGTQAEDASFMKKIYNSFFDN